MKKSILIIAMFLIGISYSFANNADGINDNVTTSFKRDFSNAKEVSWETRRVYVKATFKLNEQVTYAYYSTEGDLIAVTRNIVSTQLPINQLMNLNANYKDYWITDLFEINSNDETSYYISLENADYKLVLRSTSGDWQVYSKKVKN